MTNNQLTDISQLSACSNLETVDLTNNQLTDISALFNLPRISSVSAIGNPIPDLGSLQIHPENAFLGIATLQVSYHEDIDWEKLAEIENLTVYVNNVPARQVDTLQKLGFWVLKETDNG